MKTMKLTFRIVLASVALTCAADAFPQYSQAAGIGVGYKNEFYGPALSNLSAWRPNLVNGDDNNLADPIRSENKLTVGYLWDTGEMVGAGFEANILATKGIAVRDPYIFLRHKKLIQGNFKADVALRAYLGVSPGSLSNRSPLSFRAIQDSYYFIPNSRFYLGLSNYVQTWVLNNPKSGTLDWRLFLMASANYQLSKPVSAGIAFKGYSNHKAGKPLGLDGEPSVIGPTVSWDATRELNLNPYLDFSTDQGLALDSVTMGLNASLKVL